MNLKDVFATADKMAEEALLKDINDKIKVLEFHLHVLSQTIDSLIDFRRSKTKS